MTTTPTSDAADLPDAMHMAELLENPINVVCQKTAAAVLRHQHSEFERLRALAAGQATAAPAQPAPATQQPEGDVVAYLDVGANGYLDLGSELSEDALQQLPKGRHALVIAGTYGIDGYVAAPQPSPTAQLADSVQEDAERLDFIERHPEMSLRHRKGRWAFLGFTNYEYEMLPSLRAAIDATRKQGGA